MGTKISKNQSGVAGEYFVAAELSRRGILASISLRHSRGIDIMVANPESYQSLTIQVKTNQNSSKSWPLSKKVEENYSDDLIYVFVNLNKLSESPSYHIVPSKTVAEFCYESHRKWLSEPGRNGQQRKDNSLRKFKDFDDEYLDNWEIIESKLKEA